MTETTGNWLDRKRFAVWGLGKSGKAAANLLARRGKTVVASDIRSADELAEDAADLDDRVEWTGGQNVIADAEVVVTSPGLRPGLEVFERARRRGVPVISEVDLAYDASDAPWIGITGTDGKSTTTSLVGAMLDAGGRDCVVAGNIGTALCDVVGNLDDEVVVAELSANQLWSCHHLSVDTAAITNIAEDHLDYFEDFADYPKAKRRIVQLQRPEAETVLPADRGDLRDELAVDCQRGVTYFGVGESSLEAGKRIVFFDQRGRGRWQDENGEGVWFDDFSSAALIGPHNQLNAACAAAVAHTMGVAWESMGQALRNFSALPHRMEPVATVEDVTYIDDSKATNAHASMAGLKGIDGHLVVIAGGRDKGLDLDDWAREVASRAARVVVIGEITARMVELLQRQGASIDCVDTLDEAVERAHDRARPGSTVVLSPACSSYDMFDSYRQRGRQFRRAVRALSSR